MSVPLLIGLSLICSIIGVYLMVNQKPKRAEPIKEATKVQAAIEVGYSYWRLVVFLPAMHFVTNMKRALIKNTTSLKTIWQNDKDILIKLYGQIPLEQRKKFVKTLIDEMRQSLEVYFEKDQFFLSIVTGFEPYGLAYISEAEAAEAAEAVRASTNARKDAMAEDDDNIVEITDLKAVDKEVQAARSQTGEGNGLRNRKNNTGNTSKSTIPTSKTTTGNSKTETAASDKLLHMHLSRYFEEVDAVVQKFSPIAVVTAENMDDLDPELTTTTTSTSTSTGGSGPEERDSEEQPKEAPGVRALREQVRVFLEVVRSLVVVMFLHQFLKRYPVDPSAGADSNTWLYSLFGEKTTRVVKALRFAVLSGLAVVVIMAALQHFGVLDEVFWGMAPGTYSL